MRQRAHSLQLPRKLGERYRDSFSVSDALDPGIYIGALGGKKKIGTSYMSMLIIIFIGTTHCFFQGNPVPTYPSWLS